MTCKKVSHTGHRGEINQVLGTKMKSGDWQTGRNVPKVVVDTQLEPTVVKWELLPDLLIFQRNQKFLFFKFILNVANQLQKLSKPMSVAMI